MKFRWKKYGSAICSGVIAICVSSWSAFCAETTVIEDFSGYQNTAEANLLWQAFDAANPAPSCRLTEDFALRLTIDEPNCDRILGRDFSLNYAGRDIASMVLTLRSAAENSADSYCYLALRDGKNAPNLLLADTPLVPGETMRWEIPNQDGKFSWWNNFYLLFCMHNGSGAAMNVDLLKIELKLVDGVAAAPSVVVFEDTPELRQARRSKLLHAKTTQFDPGFSYYQSRSYQSIARELEVNGFDGAYCYAIRETDINCNLIQTIQSRGMAAALMTLPSLVYWSDAELAAAGLPGDYRDYLIQFTGNDMDGYRFISFINPAYNEWYKRMLKRMLERNHFDGFTFAEIMYPIYDGPTRNPVLYADVSPAFAAAFQQATGYEMPNFTDPDSPDYFRNQLERYQALVEYRVRTINDFYNDIVNGRGGAREYDPEMVFATWTLGTDLEDGVAKLREWEGNDIASMIAEVKPDIHFIQTHAPDWCNPALPGSYPEKYQQFFDAIRQANPAVKIGLQGDFGSWAVCRRDENWRKEFYEACAKQQVDTTTYYEFSIRDEVYTKAPVLKQLERSGDSELMLIFDQVIHPDSAAVMTGRTIGAGQVERAVVDGNLLICKMNLLPGVGDSVTVDVSGIGDKPEARLAIANPERNSQGAVNRIPDAVSVTLPVAGK